MRKLLLKCSLSLGDIVLLTGAVRDLQRAYPGEFQIGVRTSCSALWWHNPRVRIMKPNECGARTEIIECACPLVSAADRLPAHALHGFTDFLSARLNRPFPPLEFRGDIHLSQEERSQAPPIAAWTKRAMPYWLVLAGGKHDLTIKWWSHQRYQEVVDHFRDRILFVQLGRPGDHHPRLHGTVDLRGRTNLRQLIEWVHHAEGVLCGVTGLMHLAAAVPRPDQVHGLRPCVVVAGGREPAHWEAYPGHQFLHTIGSLPCCQTRGCWRSRTVPTGDGSVHDSPDYLCLKVSNGLPKCMDLITAAEVIHQIEKYLNNGQARVLSRGDLQAARGCVRQSDDGQFDRVQAAWRRGPARAERFLKTIPPYPRGRYAGRGLVMCAGGADYFANAWASIHLIRQHGCRLPIELWHLGPAELNARMRALIEPLGVRCVDGLAVGRSGARTVGGYAIKPYALLHSSFREVLLLDADNLVVRDPSYLFEDKGYLKTGALFWPDYGFFGPEAPIWRLCGVAYRDEPEFESGQMVVNKQRCWRALNLAWHYNQQAGLYYHVIHGDKDTFHLAFRKVGQAYAMPRRPILPVARVMVQHDPKGRRLFEHLGCRKLRFHQPNPPIPGLCSHASALKYLAALQRRWDGKIVAD